MYEGQRASAAPERGRLKPRLNGLRPRNLPAQVAEKTRASPAFWRPRRAAFAAQPVGAASAASRRIVPVVFC